MSHTHENKMFCNSPVPPPSFKLFIPHEPIIEISVLLKVPFFDIHISAKNTPGAYFREGNPCTSYFVNITKGKDMLFRATIMVKQA